MKWIIFNLWGGIFQLIMKQGKLKLLKHLNCFREQKNQYNDQEVTQKIAFNFIEFSLIAFHLPYFKTHQIKSKYEKSSRYKKTIDVRNNMTMMKLWIIMMTLLNSAFCFFSALLLSCRLVAATFQLQCFTLTTFLL